MDFGSVIANLPAGTDVYAFVEAQLATFIFPPLGKAFWTEVYVVVAIACVCIVTFLAGYALKVRAGRMQWILHDGAATRLHHMHMIPILYIANALSMLGFTFTIRRDLQRKNWSASSGRFWFLCWLPLVLSFTLISHTAISSSPPVRNALARAGKPWSLIYLNGGLLAAWLLVSGAICYPALIQGKLYTDLQNAYDAGVAIVQQARVNNDLQALGALQVPMLDLANTTTRIQRVVRIGGIIYSVNSITALLAGCAMAYILRSAVSQRIDRLERKSSLSSFSASDSVPTIVVPTLSSNDMPSSCTHGDVEMAARTFKPNPDAPFSNIVKTSSLPERFQVVLDQDATSVEKAQQLRIVLKRDQYAILVYVSCVLVFLTLTLFMCANGEASMDFSALIRFNFSYCCWAFLIPACLASAAFLYDALHSPSVQSPKSSKKTSSTVQPFIGVSQTFSITEDTGDSPESEEKKLRF